MTASWNSLVQSGRDYAHQVLNLSTLVAINPPAEWKFMWVYVGFIGLNWIIALGGYFLPIHSTLKSRIASIAWTNAFLGLFLFFFRYTGIPLLGMDLWRFFQELFTGIAIIFLIRFALTDLKKIKLQEKATLYKEKFLPKSNK